MSRPSKVSIALALVASIVGAPLQAQTALPVRDQASLFKAPASIAGPVDEVIVQVDNAPLIADGVSRVPVHVELHDRSGNKLETPVVITIETSAVRVLLADKKGRPAETDENGPGALDIDRSKAGTQITVEHGQQSFWIVAPGVPQEVRVRVTAGQVSAEGGITFDPELRNMLAVGLVEGVIGFHGRGQSSGIEATRIDDGFEQELKSWSRKFGNDRGDAAARAAMFLKGKIRGDTLLTLAYDSEQDDRKRLLRDVRADEYYPVYGDSSVKGFDAQSASKLYVRIDENRNYLLYGDFSTSARFSPLIGGRAIAPVRLRDLGQYNRTMTGFRAHTEGDDGYGNLFVTRDTLKQVVEEYLANGTSGPFAVRNNTAVSGTEQVEILVRDRNNRSVIIDSTPLARLVDYTFEPFSGRILLNRAVPSLDPNGNPQSIRITYEVDLGGEAFWVYGLDGQYRFGEHLEVGGSYVDDKNDLAPYRLGSANVGLRFGEHTQLVAEVARTEGRYNTGNGIDTLLTPGFAGINGDASGNAGRVEFNHTGEIADLRIYAGRSDTTFDNPSSSYSGGRTDAGARAVKKLDDDTSVFGEAVRNEDRLQGGTRSGGQVGVAYRLTPSLTIDIAIKRQEENGQPVTVAPGLGANPAATTGTSTSPLTQSGGFFGNGSDGVNSTNGAPLLATNTGVPTIGAGRPLDATTVQVGAHYQLTETWGFNAEVEHDITGDDKKRLALGSTYKLDDRSRLYARWETQQGLASTDSLNPADKSTTFTFGADTTYWDTTQFYSEYRLRDALGDTLTTRDTQLANGVRNSWQIQEGLRATTAAEYLKIMQGEGRAAYALIGGLDYTANPLWKAMGRLEYRRLMDDRTTIGDDRQDSYLSTMTLARKLDRDWTLLLRNYALVNTFADRGDRIQDRAQVGFAYRPVDTNAINALARYEYKAERDQSGLPTDIVGTEVAAVKRDVHIVAVNADYHPSRPWWSTGRLAAKSVKEQFYGTAVDRYTAMLLAGRTVYDITEDWDLGLLGSILWSPQGRSKQYASGLEVGYLLKTNLWLSLGYNFTGFSDRDLAGAEYTRQGVFVRLRFKFDEDLFKRDDPAVNPSLARNR
ncbi:hypothetical protein BH10PSE17_BH10PSE17_10110 [soil metagenome]